MNGVPLPLHSKTFVDQLRDAGWLTALIGKAHLQPMTSRPAAWLTTEMLHPRSQATTDLRSGPEYRQEAVESWSYDHHQVRLPYYGFSHAELCLEHGDQVGGDYKRWLKRQGADPALLCGRQNAFASSVPPVLDAWRTRLPEELHPTSYVATRTIDWLRHYVNSGVDAQPFFVHCSFPDPHHPFNPPGRFWDMYAPEDATPANYSGVATAVDPPLKRALHAERDAGRRPAGTSRAIGVTEHEARVAIALNHGSVSFVDEAVGRVLAYLRQSGLDRTTVVVFSSDHGDFMGDHGLLNKGPLHYQGLIRVPLIWSDPQGPRRVRDTRLCSTLDIGTTLLLRCGVTPAHGMQGSDLFAQEGSGERDAVLVEEETHHRYPESPFPLRVRTLVTKNWRISIRADHASGELFALDDDPKENMNLWNREDLLSIRADLTFRLVQEMQRHADDMPLPMLVA